MKKQQRDLVVHGLDQSKKAIQRYKMEKEVDKKKRFLERIKKEQKWIEKQKNFQENLEELEKERVDEVARSQKLLQSQLQT